MIEIINNGGQLVSTNYFDSENAQAGFAYLSWNAGDARLLVPDNRVDWLDEIKTGQSVIIEVSAAGIVVVFDDGTDTPFCITIDHKQNDRAINEKDIGKAFTFRAYTRSGEVYSAPGVFE